MTAALKEYVRCRVCGFVEMEPGAIHEEYRTTPEQRWVKAEEAREWVARAVAELRWQIGVTRDDSYAAGRADALRDAFTAVVDTGYWEGGPAAKRAATAAIRALPERR